MSNEFLRGYICAVVNLIKIEGEVTTQVKELFKAGIGEFSYVKLKGIDIPDYDMHTLMEHKDRLK